MSEAGTRRERANQTAKGKTIQNERRGTLLKRHCKKKSTATLNTAQRMEERKQIKTLREKRDTVCYKEMEERITAKEMMRGERRERRAKKWKRQRYGVCATATHDLPRHGGGPPCPAVG